MKNTFSLIYARSLNGVIGNNNDLPGWKIPGDLKRFKELTSYGIVVMGYKTFMSLPDNSRPLKDRINVVITTRQGLEDDETQGLYFVNSIDAAKECLDRLLAKEELPVWIIGGASIYKAFEFDATHIYETVLMAYVDGDVEYKHLTRFGQVLESENVVMGEYNGKTCNVHHRVWRAKKFAEMIRPVGKWISFPAPRGPWPQNPKPLFSLDPDAKFEPLPEGAVIRMRFPEKLDGNIEYTILTPVGDDQKE